MIPSSSQVGESVWMCGLHPAPPCWFDEHILSSWKAKDMNEEFQFHQEILLQNDAEVTLSPCNAP